MRSSRAVFPGGWCCTHSHPREPHDRFRTGHPNCRCVATGSQHWQAQRLLQCQTWMLQWPRNQPKCPCPRGLMRNHRGRHPRQRRRLQLISQSTRILGADTAALELDLGEPEEPPRHPTVALMTESEGPITLAVSSDTESVPGNQVLESQKAQHVEEVQLGRVLQQALCSLDECGSSVYHASSSHEEPTSVRERSIPSLSAHCLEGNHSRERTW